MLKVVDREDWLSGRENMAPHSLMVFTDQQNLRGNCVRIHLKELDTGEIQVSIDSDCPLVFQANGPSILVAKTTDAA